MDARHKSPRLAPLAAALICAGGAAHAAPFSAALPAGWHAGNGSGVAALMQALRAAAPKPRRSAVAAATTRAVTSCADDGGAGTLRSIVAAANSGDTVDLACSTVTLAQGAIPVLVDQLTIRGRGAAATAIDGAGADRVFIHYGYDTLKFSGITVRNGVNRLSGYKVAGGACILGNAYVTLDHSVVSGCTSIGEGAYGGGILARGITMYTSTLVNNASQGSLLSTLTASYGGGAFAYRGTAALYDSTVSGNRALPDPANTHGSYDTGAGIFADNGGYALRSTIFGNVTDGTGGGIASHAAFFLSDSTISGNRAGKGGGIFLRVFYGTSANNSTIAFNGAATGGGIYVAGKPQAFTLQSMLIANNAGGDFAAQMPLTPAGANNLVITSANATLPTDTLHADPLLLPLANNGGPTLTHALSVGSPAIDGGNNVINLATDQRGAGFPRTLGAAPDIGAYESAPPPPPPIPVPMLSACWSALLALLLGASAQIFTRRSRYAAHAGQRSEKV